MNAPDQNLSNNVTAIIEAISNAENSEVLFAEVTPENVIDINEVIELPTEETATNEDTEEDIEEIKFVIEHTDVLYENALDSEDIVVSEANFNMSSNMFSIEIQELDVIVEDSSNTGYRFNKNSSDFFSVILQEHGSNDPRQAPSDDDNNYNTEDLDDIVISMTTKIGYDGILILENDELEGLNAGSDISGIVAQGHEAEAEGGAPAKADGGVGAVKLDADAGLGVDALKQLDGDGGAAAAIL